MALTKITSRILDSSGVTILGTIATGVWAATDIAVLHGGTGASTAGAARTNLGLVIGTHVLAQRTFNDSNWDNAYTDRLKWDGGTTGLTASTGRTSLGLGTVATTAASDYATAAQGTKADTAHGWGNHTGGGYVKTTTNQTIAGNKTFSGDILIDSALPRLEMKLNGGTAGYVTISGGNNQIVTGSVSGDMAFRVVNKSYLFSVNNGSSSALTILSSGASTFSGRANFNGNVNVVSANAEIWIGESTSGGGAGFLKWDDTNNYLYLGNSYGSAYNKNIVISSSGNVGIGTTSPSTQLEIASNTAAGALKITQSTEVSGLAMVYIDNNSASNKPALRIDVAAGGNSTDTHGVLINNSGPGYGLIVNGGNVGIGTTSPTVSNSGYGMEIGNNSANAGIRLNAGASGWGYIEYYNGSTAKFVMGYRQTDDSFRIRTGASLVGGNGLDISSGGLVTFQNGIKFGSSETLDTYDEGTFSPSIQKNDSNGSGQLSSGSQTRVGRYVRVGNQVAIWIYVYMSAANAPATTHNTAWLVQGLPFTFRGSTPYQFLPCGYAMISGTQVNQHVRLQINNSTDSGIIYARHHIDSNNNNGGVIEFTFAGVLEIN